MKALVFGTTGQVATELFRRRPSDVELVQLGRAQADLSDPRACAAAVRLHDPDVVINAAAYTAVDKAEDEEALATIINGDAPGAMARAAKDIGVPFLHVSTDYVFDGSGTRAWQPDDATAPLGAYGRSKLAGEVAIAAAGGVYAIMRTSWVVSAHGANFVKTMLRLAETRDRLTIVADQIGGPTPAADIADALWKIAADLKSGAGAAGTYHFAGAPAVSWADFAREIFAQASRDVEVVDISSADYPTPAKRPKNSRMDCSSLESAFNISAPDWRIGLRQIIEDLHANG